MGDPASIQPVRDYLARGGSEKLLAHTVRVRLADKGALKEALPDPGARAAAAKSSAAAKSARLTLGRGGTR